MGMILKSHDRRLLKLAFKDGNVVAFVRVVIVFEATSSSFLIAGVLNRTYSIVLDLKSHSDKVAELLGEHLFSHRVKAFTKSSLGLVALSRVLFAPVIVLKITQLFLVTQ